MCSVPKVGFSGSRPDSKSLCIFCFKNGSNDSRFKSPQGERIHDTFFKLLERFFDHSLWTPGNIEIGINLPKGSDHFLGCCVDCVGAISSFCAEFQQLETLLLRLQWRLEGLVKVMKQADRVPSRVKRLKGFFDTQLDSPKGDDTEGSNAGLDDLKKFRQIIVKQCKRKFLRDQPQVVVKKLKDDVAASISLTSQNRNNSSDGRGVVASLDVDTSLGRMPSLAAIAFLASPSPHLKTNNGHSLTPATQPGICDNDTTEDTLDRDGYSNAVQNVELTSEMEGTSYSGNDETTDFSSRKDNSSNDDTTGVTMCQMQTDVSSAHVTHPLMAAETKIGHDDEEEDVDILSVDDANCINLRFDNEYISGQGNALPQQWHPVTFNPMSDIGCRTGAAEIKSPSFAGEEVKNTCIPKRKRCHDEDNLIPHDSRHFKAIKSDVMIPQLTNSNTIDPLAEELEKYFKVLQEHENITGHRTNTRMSKRNIKSDCAGSNKNAGYTEIWGKSGGLQSPAETPLNHDLLVDTNISHLKMEEDDERDDSDYIDPDVLEESSCPNDDALNCREVLEPIKNTNIKLEQFLYCRLDGCDRQWNIQNKDEYESHQKLHSPGYYKCHFCDRVEENVIRLSTHEMYCHSPSCTTAATNERKSYALCCPRCNFHTGLKANYQRHFAETHNIVTEYESLDTDVVAKQDAKELTTYVQEETGKDSCLDSMKHYEKLCETNEPGISSLLRCEECPAYFADGEHLISHNIRVHYGNKCPLCNEDARTPSILIAHLEKVHPGFEVYPNLNFHCDMGTCNKKFATEKELERHKLLAKNNQVHRKHQTLLHEAESTAVELQRYLKARQGEWPGLCQPSSTNTLTEDIGTSKFQYP